MKLFLIRHGNTFNADEIPTQVGLKTDLPLTTKGIEQAYTLAEYFKNHNIFPNKIYCGNLKRQIKTANIIATKLNKKTIIKKTDVFNEIDYGLWEGVTAKEISTKWPKEYLEWIEKAKWPSNIFNGDDKLIISKISDWLHSQQEGETIFVISSQGLIRYFLYLTDPKFFTKIQKENMLSKYKIKTGHFCELEIRDSSINILNWNKSPK